MTPSAPSFFTLRYWILGFIWMGWVNPVQGLRVLPLSEFKRLEVPVSQDRINRIAILGDRIAQIFGDEGRFTVELDETNGQVFLKVAGVSSESISLSLVTESGKTQDLLLKPQKGLFDPLVFQGTGSSGPVSPVSSQSQMTSVRMRSPSWEEPFSLVRLLRESFQGRLSEKLVSEKPVSEKLGSGETSRKSPLGVTVTFERAFASGSYGCWIYTVTNTTSTALELEISKFYEPGDEALGLRSLLLEKGGQTQLSVIRQDKSCQDSSRGAVRS
jgi:hypothetical protein